MTNKVELSREVIGQLPDLKYIDVQATGFNVVDIEAARERDIPVTNIPTYGTASVAQMVFAHILNLTQRVAHHAGTVREGRWSECRDFCYWDFPLRELDGLTLGIVGFGRIGQRTGKHRPRPRHGAARLSCFSRIWAFPTSSSETFANESNVL